MTTCYLSSRSSFASISSWWLKPTFARSHSQFVAWVGTDRQSRIKCRAGDAPKMCHERALATPSLFAHGRKAYDASVLAWVDWIVDAALWPWLRRLGGIQHSHICKKQGLLSYALMNGPLAILHHDFLEILLPRCALRNGRRVVLHRH